METTLEASWLGTRDDIGDLAHGEWRRHWRLRLVIGDDSEDLAGVETTLETKQLGNGDNCRDLPAGDLR